VLKKLEQKWARKGVSRVEEGDGQESGLQGLRILFSEYRQESDRPPSRQAFRQTCIHADRHAGCKKIQKTRPLNSELLQIHT
jgi:hypothetical protein